MVFYQRRKKNDYDDDNFPFPADFISDAKWRGLGVAEAFDASTSHLSKRSSTPIPRSIDEQSVAIRVRHVYGVRDNHVVRVRGG